MGGDGKPWLGGLGGVTLATEIPGEGYFFHPAMNASLFNCLERGGLRLRKAAFDAAFGENPASAASLNQKKLDAAFGNAVTNGRDLLSFF